MTTLISQVLVLDLTTDQSCSETTSIGSMVGRTTVAVGMGNGQ